MAKKRPAQRTALRKETVSREGNDNFKWVESYTSLLLGIVVVVILAILIVSFVRNRGANQDTTSTQTEVTQTPQEKELAQRGITIENGKKIYTVVAGDTLWRISEKVYDTGYNWTDIAQANEIKNPEDIEVGDKLIIPDVEPEMIGKANGTPTPTTRVEATAVPTTRPTVTATVSPTPVKSEPTQAPVGQKETGKGSIAAGTTYTVKAGDHLWDIAVRTYGDGYRWVDIARANNLSNPDIIHPDNKLTLPK